LLIVATEATMGRVRLGLDALFIGREEERGINAVNNCGAFCDSASQIEGVLIE
jgi:hypothetical protein